jgi:hypothetical protein
MRFARLDRVGAASVHDTDLMGFIVRGRIRGSVPDLPYAARLFVFYLKRSRRQWIFYARPPMESRFIMANAHHRPLLDTSRSLGRLDVIALLLAAVAVVGLIVMFALQEHQLEPRDCRAVTPDASRMSCYDQVIDSLRTGPARGATAPKL